MASGLHAHHSVARMFLAALTVFSVAGLACFPVGSAPPPPQVTRTVDFVKDIQPIFAEHCFRCHGPNKQEAQFRLDSKDIALKGGELGVAIVPGKSAESLLVQAVSGTK